ncbi:MAG: DUF1499 domain-containing protein [Betaproteobacteria bacterium]|nr:DUF1499 domain-containing protein [Betaproteobacteria bacterium]
MRLIHDVCTDPDAPLEFIALASARKACRNGAAYSGLAAAQHRLRYPDIKPAIFSQPAATVFSAAHATARARRWHIIDANVAEGRIEATAETRWLKFKDDVVIRVRADGDASGGTRLDMRSASRVGQSDFGENARRIRRFWLEIKSCLKSNT